MRSSWTPGLGIGRKKGICRIEDALLHAKERLVQLVARHGHRLARRQEQRRAGRIPTGLGRRLDGRHPGHLRTEGRRRWLGNRLGRRQGHRLRLLFGRQELDALLVKRAELVDHEPREEPREQQHGARFHPGTRATLHECGSEFLGPERQGIDIDPTAAGTARELPPDGKQGLTVFVSGAAGDVLYSDLLLEVGILQHAKGFEARGMRGRLQGILPDRGWSGLPCLIESRKDSCNEQLLQRTAFEAQFANRVVALRLLHAAAGLPCLRHQRWLTVGEQRADHEPERFARMFAQCVRRISG